MKPYGMIPFFIPHVGCPYICTFCNQSRITGQSGISHLTAEYIRRTIEDYVGTKRHDKFWEVAFYGGSFTAIPEKLQIQLLNPAYEALRAGLIDGIRCSTRPDAVGDESIALLQSYGVRTVEIGVQSMNEKILIDAKRGHTAEDVISAVQRLKRYDMIVGVQLLPGLKGETWGTLLETAVKVVQLQPDFVRIYPVLVIDNTELADQYRIGDYTPLSTEQAIRYCAFLKEWFERHHIDVIRTGLQSTDELDSGESLVAGPYEPAMGELVVNEQFKQRIEHCIDEHMLPILTVRITYPRRLTSKVRGLNNRNVEYFQNQYPQYAFEWCEDSTRNTVRCCIDGLQYML